MTSDEEMEALRDREARTRENIRRSARRMKATVIDAADRQRAVHPWTLPVAGFCVGLAIPFLFPDRRKIRDELADEVEESASAFRNAWSDARVIAAQAVTEALGAAIRRRFGASRHAHDSEYHNGSCR